MFWCVFLLSLLTLELSVTKDQYLSAIQTEIIFSFNYSHSREVDKIFK